jgi:hypothetical protein
VFLDAADVVLAKRRISDIATMLHLRHAILCFFVHEHVSYVAFSPTHLYVYMYVYILFLIFRLQPRNLQTHFDEHRVGHPLQLSYDSSRRRYLLPKVFDIFI